MPFPDESNLTTLATLRSYLDPPPPLPAGVGFVAVTGGGSGYTTGATVAFAPAGAAATAVVVAGVVTGIVVTTPGTAYFVAPAVTISPVGAGSGALGVAYLGPDYQLQGLINRASQIIVACTNRDVIFDSGQNITERRHGTGKDFMPVNVTPIISISSLSIGGLISATIAASDGTSAGYLFDANNVYLIGYVFPKGRQNVTLVYRGGAVLGSQTQLQLEQACLVTCALWWKRRAHIDQVSISSPQGLGTIAFTQKDLPAEAWTVINDVKRVAPIV